MTMKRVDLIGNSPYCLPYNSYGVSSQNMVLDQLITPLLILISILITFVFDIVLICTMCLSAYCVISFQASFRRGFGSPRRTRGSERVSDDSYSLRGYTSYRAINNDTKVVMNLQEVCCDSTKINNKEYLKKLSSTVIGPSGVQFSL